MSDQLANLSILTGCLPGGNSVVCVSLITILGYVHYIGWLFVSLSGGIPYSVNAYSICDSLL